jgi:hypothetical protein
MMMRPNIPPLLKYTLMGAVAAAIAVGLAVWGNRGSQVRLEIDEVKSRTVATDDNSSILILELRVKNPAQVPFVIRAIRMSAKVAGRGEVSGVVVAEPDLDRVLDYYRHVGPRYNPTLKVRERLIGASLADRTVAASFPLPEQLLVARSGVVLEIEDVDGVVVAASLK